MENKKPVLERPEIEILVSDLLNIVLKRKWYAIIITLLVTISVMFLTIKQTKLYKCSTTLVIELKAPRVLSQVREVVDLGAQSYWANKEYFETQYKIIQSRYISELVVEKLSLDKDLNFLGLDKVEDPEVLDKALKESNLSAIKKLMGMISVKPVKDSRMVEITIVDTNNERASLLANTVASVYIEQNLFQKLKTTKNAAEWLASQLEDLKSKLEGSELKFYNFKKSNNVFTISLNDTRNIATQNLIAFNNKLTQVRSQKIKLKAERDQIIQIKNNGNMLDALSSVSTNKLIQQLKTDHISLSNQYAELKESYLEDHPKPKSIKHQMNLVNKNINAEIQKIVESITLKYQEVKETEKGLKVAIEEIKEKAVELNKVEMEYARLDRELSTNRNLYNMVLNRLKETDLTGLLHSNNIRQLDRALPPKKPYKPNIKLNLLFGIFLGLSLGVGYTFLLSYLDNTIKTQEDVEKVLGLTFLGIVPSIKEGTDKSGRYYYSSSYSGYSYGYGYGSTHRKRKKKGIKPPTEEEIRIKAASKDLFIHEYPKSSIAECCRTIRTNILFMAPGRSLDRLLISSAGPQEGKTSVTIQIGITMAQSGSSVLLIDTDLRRPRIHKAFGMVNDLGVTSYLLGDKTLDGIVHDTPVPNLKTILCGPIPPNPAELIHTEKFADMLNQLDQKYDRLIFDSPPIAAVADSLILANMCDGVILVVKSAKTTKEMVGQAKKSLQDVNANIMGVVLNDLDLANKHYGYYYYYYYRKYGYYYGENEKRDEGLLDVPNENTENEESEKTQSG